MQQVSTVKEMCDVYVPIQLFNHPVVVLLDKGCDTSIIGTCLLPDGTCVQPTTNTLLAANDMQIPLDGEYKICFQVGGKEFAICGRHQGSPQVHPRDRLSDGE